MKNDIYVESLMKHYYKHNLIDERHNINNDNNNDNNINNNFISKIKPYNFFSKNEIYINNILHTLDNKINRYITIKNADKLQISAINKVTLQKENLQEKNKYIMIKYNEKEDQYIEGILNFLHNKCEKEYVSGVIESYIHIIKLMDQLQKNGIIYFNFTSKNIKFKNIDNPHCMLYDFEKSLLERKLIGENNSCINYFYNFSSNNQDYSFKAFEIHVLFYLYKMDENENYLSKYKITNIINVFVKNMKTTIKDQDSKLIEENCHQFMHPFINKNKNDIIVKLISYYKTWDNYSVSILYLHLLENIIQGYKIQVQFISKFQDILHQNVSQNPNNRLSIEETIKKFNDLYQYWE